jgi:hypothetical protein
VGEDAGKENSKNGANTGGGAAAAATNGGGPLPLDAEGLPPLRLNSSFHVMTKYAQIRISKI